MADLTIAGVDRLIVWDPHCGQIRGFYGSIPVNMLESLTLFINEFERFRADRLSHKNIESNPYASYLFKESGEGYTGKRLYLKRIKEETDKAIIESYMKRDKSKNVNLFLVYFHIEKVLSLIGD